MKKGITIVAAVCFGAAFGACVRNVVSDARAQPSAGGTRLEYKVVGASMSASGYEKDLNEAAAEGWRYSGSIGLGGANSLLVVERNR